MTPLALKVPRSWICAALASISFAPWAAGATKCEDLASLTLKGGTITASHVIAPGQFAPPGRAGGGAAATFAKLPAFCRVEATLKPSSDSEIRMEVWLPASGWNGKLVEAGNGAFAGSISYGPMASAVAAGYAATSSDTGHTGNSGAFILEHPEKLTDFAYRAVHENAIAAKSITEAFYGSGPTRAFFSGCSTGGRQAMGEAQRYPADFDGIIAGAPAINTTHLQAMQTWVGTSGHKDPAALIPPSKFPMIHSAVLAACDLLDGVKDGVIENPLRCTFNPASLACTGGDGPGCLTAPQVELVRKIYTGPVSASGKQVFPGLARGSEQGWNTLAGPQPMDFAVGVYQYVVFKNANWDYLSLDLDRDVAYADTVVGSIINNGDPNLKPFFSRGGKLLGYHGWSDPGITPQSSINYYKSVAAALGGEAAIANSYRLFLVPGMAHCGGGDGTSTFDMVAALDRWVDGGKAPESIPASRTRNGSVDRTRPLCPYPQEAVYKGSGSTDDAASFTCAVKP